MAFTSDQRLAFERDELFPVAGLPSADAASHVEGAYFAGTRDFIETRWSLQDQALTGEPLGNR